MSATPQILGFGNPDGTVLAPSAGKWAVTADVVTPPVSTPSAYFNAPSLTPGTGGYVLAAELNPILTAVLAELRAHGILVGV